MSMSLTRQDLAAISGIIEDKIDASDQITAIAFDEVFHRLDRVEGSFLGFRQELGAIQQTTGRIEAVQQSEVTRLDVHDVAIAGLQKKRRIT